MRKILSLRIRLILLLIILSINAQSQSLLVPKDERTKFKFAQTYFGLAGQYLPSATLNFPDGREAFISDRLQPRVLIGGTHFWGFVDFYISFPASNTIELSENKLVTDAEFTTGVMTGMKVYPFAMSNTQLDPFVGVNWSFYNVSATLPEGEGADISKHRMGLEAGLSYTTKNWHILELFGMYTPKPSAKYYTSRSEIGSYDWPGISTGFRYKRLIDFSDKRSYESKNPDLEKAKFLNAWEIGIGASTTQAIKKSEFLASETPFLNNPASWQIFPELSLAYYFFKPDIDIRLSYRPMRSNQNAFGVNHTVNRNSLALEAFKFIGDYHGFAPFVGISLAGEQYRFKQTGNNIAEINTRDRGLTTGVVFGWDIRFTRYDEWLLRTNLRYYPNASMDVEGKGFSMQQLEFNFIQLILFPERLFEK